MHQDKDDAFTLHSPEWDPQSSEEEVTNSLVQVLGIALGIAALIVLIVLAGKRGDVWRTVSFTIYGVSLIVLYLSSLLHHAFRSPQLKRFFEIFDHSAIYLLIAGTYTPITLVVLRGPWGWTLFGLVWTLALIGIGLKVLALHPHPKIASSIYIAMGWLIVFALKPLLQMAPFGLIVGLLIGGLLYTFGVVFFLWRSMPFHHTIWHLFVLSGSMAHFFTILLYLT